MTSSAPTKRFNTQPPEGGWNECGLRPTTLRLFQHTAARRRLGQKKLICFSYILSFQHTAARRRLAAQWQSNGVRLMVSTHSRPKAAGCVKTGFVIGFKQFQHTAARRRLVWSNHGFRLRAKVSTHSRPKAAGPFQSHSTLYCTVSTHSRPKAAGASLKSLAPSGFVAPISLSS